MKKLSLIFIFLFAFGYACFAQETKRIATVIEIKGTVEVKSPKGKWVTANMGTVLQEGDILRTRANSFATLNLDGKAETATVEVKEKSQLLLSELLTDKEKKSQKTLLDLATGEILIKAKKLHSEKSSFEVKTPTSIVGVRGTTFAVTVEAVE